jgi:hypothetical protein
VSLVRPPPSRAVHSYISPCSQSRHKAVEVDAAAANERPQAEEWAVFKLSNVKDDLKSVQRGTLGAFWKTAVSAMPLGGLKYSQEEQLGTYLNSMSVVKYTQLDHN